MWFSSLFRLPPLPQTARPHARKLPPYHCWGSGGRHHFWHQPQITSSHGFEHLLLVSPSTHRPGRWLLPAHPALLWEHRLHPLVGRPGRPDQCLWHWPLPLPHLPDQGFRPQWHQPASEPAVWQPYLCRGPGGCAGCVWGGASEWGTIHDDLRGGPSKWRH